VRAEAEDSGHVWDGTYVGTKPCTGTWTIFCNVERRYASGTQLRTSDWNVPGPAQHFVYPVPRHLLPVSAHPIVLAPLT